MIRSNNISRKTEPKVLVNVLLAENEVIELDDAWRKMGYMSRSGFLRDAIAEYEKKVDELKVL